MNVAAPVEKFAPSLQLIRPLVGDGETRTIRQLQISPAMLGGTDFQVMVDRGEITSKIADGIPFKGTAVHFDPNDPAQRSEVEQAIAGVRALGLKNSDGNMSFEDYTKFATDPRASAKLSPDEVVFSYGEGDPYADAPAFDPLVIYRGKVTDAPPAVRQAVDAVDGLGAGWKTEPIQF
jgi:hypothetical protein